MNTKIQLSASIAPVAQDNVRCNGELSQNYTMFNVERRNMRSMMEDYVPHWRVLLWRALVWRVSLWRVSF